MQDMDAVYRQHFRMVYQYLMSLTHQPDVAEELAQETFCQAVSSIHRYDGSCKITTWLCAIAKNQYLSYLRVFGNLSFREIGQIMGQSENWARVMFYRGKERLRKELNKHEK